MKLDVFEVACIVLVSITLILAGMLAGLKVNLTPLDNSPLISIGQLGVTYAEAPDYICDGVDDQVQFGLAETDAGTGVVNLLPGTYSITSYNITTACFMGQGWERTVIEATGEINITGSGNLRSVEVYWDEALNYAGVGLSVTCGNGEYLRMKSDLLRDVIVINGVHFASLGTRYTGTGVKFSVDAGADDSFITCATVGPLYIRGFHYGMHLYSHESGAGGEGFINGNFFNIYTYNSRHHFYMEQDGGSVSGNFVDIQCSPGSYDASKSETGITMIGSHNNDVRFYTWDWTTAATDDCIYLDSNTYNNHMWGHGEGGTIDDDGASNVITDYS